MCGGYDGDPPEFYRERIRTARKTHICFECGKAVEPGTRYQHVAGKWDATVESFAFCLPCARLMAANVEAHDAVGRVAETTLGGARDEVLECLAEDRGEKGRPYLAALRRALREASKEIR
jgi:hypothetical protein